MSILHDAHQIQKPTRKQAYAMLRLLAEENPTVTTMSRQELAQLLAYFNPPLPRVAKTPFEWVAKAVAGKKDVRHYLQYLNVNARGHLWASNGHRAHVWRNCGLKPGYYLPTGERVSEDDVGAEFPDISKAIAKRRDPQTPVYLNEVKVHHSSIPSVDLTEKVCCNLKYIRDAANGANRVECAFGGKHDTIAVAGPFGGTTAYIMPMRK